jgi:hypothetical protein
VQSHPCERRIWIELIGFDNAQPDFGVGAYLETLGFVPAALSLLITAPDIVHLHEGMESEVEFPPDYCSYVGHSRNAERRRQVWTNHQLRGLVRALRSRGVQVFLSTFTYFLYDKFHAEWVNDHLELLEVRKDGVPLGAISALKRFADGTFYEDFFIPQLARVLADYEFDGWHAADGWGPLRLPIYDSDFSDDMFEQFGSTHALNAPPEIAAPCDGNGAKMQARAAWIWRHQRRAWIDFHVDRWESFYRKKVAALHAIGKRVIINSAWTRDPFEAIYRYGVDPRKIIATGVDGIVTESLAGACDMQAFGGFRRHEYVAALLLTRAAVPDAKLWFLLGIKDVTEQWDMLRHAPTAFEAELFALADIYASTPGGLRRCADGFVACLADGIRAEEWRWMERRWEMAFGEPPARTLGATLLWSERAFDNELDDFIAQRSPTTHRLLHKLNEHGAPIYAVARLENLDTVRGPLLVLNAHLLPTEEWRRVLAYRGGDVFSVRREGESAPQLTARLHREGCETGEIIAATPLPPCDETTIVEPSTFLNDLAMRPLSSDFLIACAEALTRLSAAPRVVGGDSGVQVQATELASGELHLRVSNHNLSYVRARVDVGRPLQSVEVLSDFPCADILPEGSEFSIKVPGRGCVVLGVLPASTN